MPELNKQLLCISNYFWVQNYQHHISWLDKSITYCEQTWLLKCRNYFWRNVLHNILLHGQNAVLVVKKSLQNFYQWTLMTLIATAHRIRCQSDWLFAPSESRFRYCLGLSNKTGPPRTWSRGNDGFCSKVVEIPDLASKSCNWDGVITTDCVSIDAKYR